MTDRRAICRACGRGIGSGAEHKADCEEGRIRAVYESFDLNRALARYWQAIEAA